MKDFITINGVEFPVVVAITEAEQSLGLMWKKWPPPVMVFPYKNSGVRKFWMKNTISPLDIVFCCNKKIIAIYKGEPLSTVMLGPDSPVDLVVEFPHGIVKKNNLSVGDYIDIKFSTENAAKIINY